MGLQEHHQLFGHGRIGPEGAPARVRRERVLLDPLLTVVCIGVLLSTVTRNSAAAVVGTVGITLILAIVAQIPGLEGLQDTCSRTSTATGTTPSHAHGLGSDHALDLVCALYAVPALSPATWFPAPRRRGRIAGARAPG